MQPFRDVVGAQQVDEVEVQQEDGVAGLAEQFDGLPREDRGEEVLAAEPDDQRAKSGTRKPPCIRM